jgi:hypothetical protein
MAAATRPGSTEEREIGQMAVWSLSTAKPGNGVEQLRDDNIDTYWQSDGPQPHLINIQFHKKSTRGPSHAHTIPSHATCDMHTAWACDQRHSFFARPHLARFGFCCPGPL